jgi:NhaA family Na+:H+ antiporter
LPLPTRVSLQGVTLDGLTSLLPLGIIAGLFIKPLGISLFCWLALKLKLASLPQAPPLSRLWRSACCAGLALRCRFYLDLALRICLSSSGETRHS